jgi:membrane-bound lytic murein transglycosylase A
MPAMLRLRLALALLPALSACGPSAPPRPPAQPPAQPPAEQRLILTPRAFADLPGWTDDRQAQALVAFQRSCAAAKPVAKARDQTSPIPPLAQGGAWDAACAAAGRFGRKDVAGGDGPADTAARAFFERNFRVWLAASTAAGDGLITGYYEPTLRGCLRPRPGCRVPLYRPPPELAAGAVAPGSASVLPSRAEIEAGALAGRGLELLWVADPIDAFFLHIQGSGRVIVDDGRVIGVGYAGKNGHPYTAIGRELVRRGALAPDGVSMQSIRAWLAANPADAPSVMALNASYVFFRQGDGAGPVGTQGVVLSPGRSLAVDPAHIPLGVPVFLETTNPLAPGAPLRRLVIAQDTGGAIRGPLRGDLFWGAGAQAEAAAGRMKERGRFYLLLPAGVSP